ncbi:MAG: purine-binding chemotaxis protein CheW [Burkholderiales bacterium]|nr:purine-binding chemotaxis protein CheW [Burkholderiales bacterium]
MQQGTAGTGAAIRRAAGAETQQYLTFLLSGEMYAVGILHVKEIIEYGQLTEIPMMPPFIRGVINLRGAVVPVIDLAARFGRAAAQAGRRTCIVIVELHESGIRQDIGVVVDAVSEVIEISANQIEPAPAFGARLRTDFIEGMGKVNGKFVVILQVERVLSVEEMAMLAGVDGSLPDNVVETPTRAD